MSHNVILVVLDGLSYQVAQHALGHLQAYCQAGRAALYKLDCELPALSRPLYEAILTGVAPIDSGIVNITSTFNTKTFNWFSCFSNFIYYSFCPFWLNSNYYCCSYIWIFCSSNHSSKM